jgi:hypothetical protein
VRGWSLSWCCVVICGDCADSRSFGTAINYRLKPHWSVVPSIAAAITQSRAPAAKGQQETFNVDFHACRLTSFQPSFCRFSVNAPVRVSVTGSFSAEKNRHAGAAHDPFIERMTPVTSSLASPLDIADK